jgi:predicted AlkP superfamily pyrophosphatase or phosphodiesterase
MHFAVPHAHRRTRHLIPILPCLCALVVVAACGAPSYVRSAPIDPTRAGVPRGGVTRNVVLVSIDGLRPDAIAAFGAENLLRLMEEGTYTLKARTIDPSKTLPSHTSMLTGEPPERHQVLWNNVTSAERDVIELPNIFSVARSRGYRTAAFFSKAKFQPLQREGTLDYSQAPGGWFGRWSSERTVSDIDKYLAEANPNLLFVHLTDPDAAGHRSGWMGKEYGAAVRAADAALGRLVRTADATYGAGNYSLIVTADHGGHGTNHGSSDPRDVTIPWIAWGRGVKSGALACSSVRTMDTASTVLWMLGLTEPSDWAGTPLVQAFESPALLSGSQ